MKADMRQVIDYIECPMLYNYRYVKRLDAQLVSNENSSYVKENKESIVEMFDQEIHKIGYHIFNFIQDGNKYPGQQFLRKKWGQLWNREKTRMDIMFEASTKYTMTTRKRLEKLGVKVIENLHPKFQSFPGVPILVGQKVEVEVGSHVITVTIDLVREIKIDNTPIIEIMDFKTGIKTRSKIDRSPINFHIDHDLEMTAASMAFHKLTGIYADRITYYDMVGDTEYHTRRSEADHKTLEIILDQVEKGINSEIYYPVMNSRCLDCAFNVACSKQKWYK